MGFVAEYRFNIQPCILCVYQRYIFSICLLWCVIGCIVGDVPKWLWVILSLSFVAGLIFSVYQVGVELHWWQGPESCSGINTMKNLENLNPEQALEQFRKNLLNNNIVRCDQVNWRILGISATIWTAIFYFFAIVLLWGQRWFKQKTI